jgi:hypothetical protein
MADEKKHRFRDAIDWTRRGHWLWTLFPASWKAAIWAGALAGITALLAIVGKTTAIRWWLYSLAVLASYILVWVAAQRFAQQSKDRVDPGKPCFSIEAFDGEIHNSTQADCFFSIRNCGQRAARDVKFDPIYSKTRFHALRFDSISSIAPLQQLPLGFHCGADNSWILDGNVGRLVLFFDDTSSKESKIFYPLTVTCLDGDIRITERHTLECEYPFPSGVKLRIYPAAE